MVSKAMVFAIMSIVIAAVAAPAMAEQIVVGDEQGWKLDFDYKTWAAGKQFYVGDTLVFNYKQGVHNVIKVNQTQFASCDSSNTVEPLTTGNDMITLLAAGKKWYVCGVGQHCSQRKMKLVIDVLPEAYAPAPSPGGVSAAIDIAPAKFLPWIIFATTAFYFTVMMP